MNNSNNIFEEFMQRIGVNTDWEIIDEVVISNQNVLRPVKGYAFEILFDEIANNHLKCQIDSGPRGDTDIDRILINNHGQRITLQLKTCAISTIIPGRQFGVNLHKTHGEEVRPRNLYPVKWPCPICPHSGEEFPDYLVVLHPENGILIIPKQEIPENKTYPGHYADPSIFYWDSKWMNKWDLLGFPQFQAKSLERRSVPLQKKFPNITKQVNLTDEELVRMWLRPENFRALEMNLKGNLREPAFAKWLETFGINTSLPSVAYSKYDRITNNGIRIQIKGVSKGPTDISRKIIGVEVMGSHRQGSDRMYSASDFDYLGIVIDPVYIPEGINLDKSTYHYCLVPLTALPLHYKNKEWGTTDRIYPICKFIISVDSVGIFIQPSNNYNLPIYFREKSSWYIDKIPKAML